MDIDSPKSRRSSRGSVSVVGLDNRGMEYGSSSQLHHSSAGISMEPGKPGVHDCSRPACKLCTLKYYNVCIIIYAIIHTSHKIMMWNVFVCVLSFLFTVLCLGGFNLGDRE